MEKFPLKFQEKPSWSAFIPWRPVEARSAAKLTSNLDGFFRKWESHRELYQIEEKRKDIPEGERLHHQKGLLNEYITVLVTLDFQQRKKLLHLISPEMEQFGKQKIR